MNKLMTVLALGVAMSLGAVAGAKDASQKPLKGKITSIKPDDDKKSVDFMITQSKTKEQITIVADDTTAVTVDGMAAKLSDLTVGETVSVTPATGKPSSIVATHKKKKATAAATPAADAR